MSNGFLGLGLLCLFGIGAFAWIWFTTPAKRHGESEQRGVIQDEALRKVLREFEINLARVINGAQSHGSTPSGSEAPRSE